MSSGIEVSLSELFCRLKQIIGSITGHKGIFEMSPIYAEPRLGEIHQIALSPEKIREGFGVDASDFSPRGFGTNRSVLPFAGAVIGGNSVMKVIIPIAGSGTRLRPHTFASPKALLHVAGRPVLDYLVEPLAPTS